MTKIKIHISNVKLPFYPPCEVKCELQNRMSTEGYLYFYFIKMIFAFLNKHEACLSILITISCNFQICKHILYDLITTPLLL